MREAKDSYLFYPGKNLKLRECLTIIFVLLFANTCMIESVGSKFFFFPLALIRNVFGNNYEKY